MKGATAWIFRIALLLPPVALLTVAVPRFEAGLAVDAAFPVPIYVVMNLPLPVDTYRTASDLLSQADAADGATQVIRAEIASRSGEPQAKVLELARNGLSHSPWSARGWLILAEQASQNDPKNAAAALGHSITLGPFEYYLTGRRTRAGGALWNNLSPDGQEASLRQARLLWTTPQLSPDLMATLNSFYGSAMITRAFQNDPEELRALNRWAASVRRGASVFR